MKSFKFIASFVSKFSSKFVSKFILLLALCSANIFGYKTTIYDTPTAITLEQGEYSVETFLYGSGGLLFKFGVGAHKIINLGVIEYIDNLLGNRPMKWEIPNAFVKIRFTDLPDDSHNVALGFDSFYNGSLNPFNEKIYGLYLVYTYGFNFGNEQVSGPQLVSFGIRYPLIYEQGNVNIFASIFFNLFSYFNIGLEIENVHFTEQYKYHFILNNILLFKVTEEFQISFNLQLGMVEGSNNRFEFSREIRLMYRNFF